MTRARDRQMPSSREENKRRSLESGKTNEGTNGREREGINQTLLLLRMRGAKVFTSRVKLVTAREESYVQLRLQTKQILSFESFFNDTLNKGEESVFRLCEHINKTEFILGMTVTPWATCISMNIHKSEQFSARIVSYRNNTGSRLKQYNSIVWIYLGV